MCHYQHVWKMIDCGEKFLITATSETTQAQQSTLKERYETVHKYTNGRVTRLMQIYVVMIYNPDCYLAQQVFKMLSCLNVHTLIHFPYLIVLTLDYFFLIMMILQTVPSPCTLLQTVELHKSSNLRLLPFQVVSCRLYTIFWFPFVLSFSLGLIHLSNGLCAFICQGRL